MRPHATTLQTLARRHLTIAVVLAATVASSYAAQSFDALMQNWRGHHVSELLTTWGPPQYAYSTGDGGYVLLYVPASEDVTGTPQPILTSGAAQAAQLVHGSVPHSQPVYESRFTASWPIFRLFFVGADGSIYRSQWKGEWVCCGA